MCQLVAGTRLVTAAPLRLVSAIRNGFTGKERKKPMDELPITHRGAVMPWECDTWAI